MPNNTMPNQQEHRQRLHSEAKNMLFEAEFSKEIERQIAAKQANKDKSLVERLGIQKE
jgi:hypothetical protein